MVLMAAAPPFAATSAPSILMVSTLAIVAVPTASTPVLASFSVILSSELTTAESTPIVMPVVLSASRRIVLPLSMLLIVPLFEPAASRTFDVI